ncbi:MAG: mechanosensitive ion channel [Leptospira sp.]|nr:mechanosensitive ion channel [Leptospira sp.]
MKVFSEYLELNPARLLKQGDRGFSDNLILLVYLFVLSYIVYRILLFAFDKIKPAKDSAIQYNRRKIGRTIFATIYIISFFPIIFSSLSYLPTVMGLAAAGIVISLKEVWLNGVGWTIILGSNGFRVGDRVEVDNIMGDVVNIGLGKFTLVEVCHESGYENSTNRLVHFPNNIVLLQKYYVIPERMNFIWDEFRFAISLDSDWERAEQICIDIMNKDLILAPEVVEEKIKELSKNYLLRLGKHTPIVYTALENGKIVLSLRYLTPVRSKRMNRIIITRALLNYLKEEKNIHIVEEKK